MIFELLQSMEIAVSQSVIGLLVRSSILRSGMEARALGTEDIRASVATLMKR